MWPTAPHAHATADARERIFNAISCAYCPVPSMTLESQLFTEPNPYNPPGNLLDATLAPEISEKLCDLGRDLP